MSQEEVVWRGKPSQAINFWPYIVGGLFSFLIIPLVFILWRWLVVKNINYELTTERFKVKQGVFNLKSDEIELYRVKDYRLEQPFVLRLFSLGNVILTTSDQSHPHLVIRAVSNSEELCDKFRNQVEASRKLKHVRELSIE